MNDNPAPRSARLRILAGSLITLCLSVVALCAWCVTPLEAQQATQQTTPKAAQLRTPDRWEKEIKLFEAADKDQPPAAGGIVFVGSSSIRLWDTAKSFPHRKVINRGFGGSEMSDSVHFAPRIVVPYKPRVVVVYAGDNDIALGKSAQQVYLDWLAFVKVVRTALPETKIVFLAIKPSQKRWKLWSQQQEANELIRKSCDQPGLMFVDVATPLLGPDRMPKPEYYKADQLHLSPAGYRIWNELVEKSLAASEKP